MSEEQTYRVDWVAPEPDSWPSKYGEMHTYTMKFGGSDLTIRMNQKPTTPPPQVGQTLVGTIEQRSYIRRDGSTGTSHQFRKAAQQASLNGGGSDPRPGDPERSRRILRQHSQHMSLLALALKYPGGLPDGMDLWATVKAAADWFDKDVDG